MPCAVAHAGAPVLLITAYGATVLRGFGAPCRAEHTPIGEPVNGVSARFFSPATGPSTGSLRLLRGVDGGRARMRIAVLAPPWITVPPAGYGGIEAVVKIVMDGENGLLVADEQEMAGATDQLGAIDPARCRASVAERYDIAATTAGYERVYHRVADVGRASAALAAQGQLNGQRRAPPATHDPPKEVSHACTTHPLGPSFRARRVANAARPLRRGRHSHDG